MTSEKKKSLRIVETFKAEYHEDKKRALVYLILRLLVIAVLIRQAMNGEWNNVFLCVLTLILFLIPDFAERRLNIELPTLLEIIIVFFIFAAEILGEISSFYVHFTNWDTILHTLNGFLAAAIGFSMIDILNRSDKVALNLAPKYVALSSFTFSMTIGVIWEFFEFGMDMLTNTDMQKDVYIDSISSTLLNPTGGIEPVTESIDSVVINGEVWQGYIDIGLIDTMGDLFVNFIGAIVFSVFGYFYIKGTGNRVSKFVKGLVPTIKDTNVKAFDRKKKKIIKSKDNEEK